MPNAFTSCVGTQARKKRRYTCIGEPKLFPPLFVSFSLAYNDVLSTTVVFLLDCIVCLFYLSISECDEWVSPFLNS